MLEMLHAIIMKFPPQVVNEQSQTLFLQLVVCLVNDSEKKVRLMTGAAIKLLIGRVTPQSLHSILEYTLSWYSGEKQGLWSAAAQVHSSFFPSSVCEREWINELCVLLLFINRCWDYW